MAAPGPDRTTNDIVKRRLLVLSFHAPPEMAVGGLRWAGLTRHLAERGWEIRVITASPDAASVIHPDGLSVHEVPRWATLGDWYRRWKRARAAKKASGGPESGFVNPADGRPGLELQGRGAVRLVRSELAALLSFPDHGRGWMFRAARATRRVARDWAPDVVVSTGPPHSVHVAAWLGLGRSGTPWIVDLRDPWATPDTPFMQTGWSGAVARRIEASVFRRADNILTTTPEFQERLQGRFPRAVLSWLPNGVDVRELPPRRERHDPGLSICHLGTVYYNRDPTPVLRAFATFLAAHPDAASVCSTLRFVGYVSGDFRRELERTVGDLGLSSHVEITGAVPRERALEILAGSRMALVLAQGQDIMVPAKLYEAVALGLRTLVVTEPDSATGREGLRLGAAVHGPDDEAGMVATMEEVWAGGRDTGGGITIPSRIDHAHLAGELEGILDSVCVRPAAPVPGPG
jgi:glycosyltransferase involved in cell wall biosynthesis